MYYVPGTVLCDTTDILRVPLWRLGKFISPYTLYSNVKFLGLNYSVYFGFDNLDSFYEDREIKWDVQYFSTIPSWIIIV